MDNQQTLDQLVTRYLSNQATVEELEVFISLLRSGKLEETMHRILNEQINNQSEGK